MDTTKSYTRRRVLGTALALAPVLLAPRVTPGRGPGESCPPTVGQTEGPFYPRGFARAGGDLLGGAGRPGGEPIWVTGRVTDAACRPLAGAVVEVWQADANGRYDHPADRPGPRDPNFRYRGRLRTDGEGRYRFRTVVPGPYRAGFGWWRPPHVHFKVHVQGREALTTQMYFPGHRYNAEDRILGAVPADERHTVMASPGAPGADGLTPYTFDLALG